MQKKVILKLLILILSILVFTTSGCAKRRIEELKKEKLFSIPIGKGEEEIGVVREKSGQFIGPEPMLFKNGFFYVVDRVNQKILKITTPGDIILVLAKGSKGEEEYIQEENVIRTKQRRYFLFHKIERIAVDNENNIYVEDQFTQKIPEKTEIDIFGDDTTFELENNEIYASYILKFDRLGGFLYRIGNGGRDTEPFNYIYKVDVDMDGNLIVLTTDDNWEKWRYYKFDSEGNLLLEQVIISKKVIDGEDSPDTSLFIMDVLPAWSSPHLLYWISLYDTKYDTKKEKKGEDMWGEEIEIHNVEDSEDKHKRIEKEYTRDLLCYKLLYFDLKLKKIDKSYRWENRLGRRVETTEELLGIDGRSNGFLWKYVNNTKAVISIFRPSGSVLAKRSFVFEEGGIWTNINVALDGSVSAIKVNDKFLDFYRWRSDRLIASKGDSAIIKEFLRGKIREFKNVNP